MESWPEIVIAVTTWCGPPERNIGAFRLKYMDRMIAGMKRHLKYPRYTWHIADDNSGKEYQRAMLSKLPRGKFTFSTTRTVGGDMGHNLNKALRMAYRRSDIVLLWHEDRWLIRSLNLEPCVKLLMDERFGLIRLKPRRLDLTAHHYQQHGAKWWLLDRKGCVNPLDAGPHLLHKRFTDYYGFYPAGIIPSEMESRFSSRFIEMEHGPDIVCPDSRWHGDEMPWGSHSTWE